MQDGQVRDFGAGILSSPGETRYSVESPISNRVLIDPCEDHDLLRLATTDYLISEYQKTYFVMESFDKLASLTSRTDSLGQQTGDGFASLYVARNLFLATT